MHSHSAGEKERHFWGGGFSRAELRPEARGPEAGEELRQTYSSSSPKLSRATLTSKIPTSSIQRRSQE